MGHLHQLEQRHAAIAEKYQIRPDMAKRLRALRDYEIIIVCDDSGSMNTPLRGSGETRWHRLCEIVKLIVDIGIVFDSNGVDIYFLNQEPLFNVTEPKRIDAVFEKEPAGYSPLVPVLRRIFQLPPTRRGHDKKLLVFVATDGAPTDDNEEENFHEFEEVMKDVRQIDRTFVQFLICTDDEFYVDFLTMWDRTMVNVDVTEEYEAEKKKILRCQGADFPFSFGDYVVKALVGSIDPDMDALND